MKKIKNHIKKTPKNETIKPVVGWMVECSKGHNWKAYQHKISAKVHCVFLDKEYRGYCSHKLIKVKITQV